MPDYRTNTQGMPLIELDDELCEALSRGGFPPVFIRIDVHPRSRRILLHFDHHAHRAALAKHEDD